MWANSMSEFGGLWKDAVGCWSWTQRRISAQKARHTFLFIFILQCTSGFGNLKTNLLKFLNTGVLMWMLRNRLPCSQGPLLFPLFLPLHQYAVHNWCEVDLHIYTVKKAKSPRETHAVERLHIKLITIIIIILTTIIMMMYFCIVLFRQHGTYS